MREPNDEEWSDIRGAKLPEELWSARWQYATNVLFETLWDSDFEPQDILEFVKTLERYVSTSPKDLQSLPERPAIVLDGRTFSLQTPIPDPRGAAITQTTELPELQRNWIIEILTKPEIVAAVSPMLNPMLSNDEELPTIQMSRLYPDPYITNRDERRRAEERLLKALLRSNCDAAALDRLATIMEHAALTPQSHADNAIVVLVQPGSSSVSWRANSGNARSRWAAENN